MGYYSSLLQRKFKDVVGKRYETVLREYGEFLLTKEEMVVPEIESVLLPLDAFATGIPDELVDVLSAYNATVSLTYIVDAQVYSLLTKTLDRDTTEEFRRKKEEHGRQLLDAISRRLENSGMTVRTRLFIGQKGDDVVQMAEEYDMIALSKRYGGGETETSSISPLALRICQRLSIPAVIY
ncbi:universal stress protein [Methanoculleus sp. FWC-SCC1]|uniref:Universal stress protein n=1 Tax=Methanoculleus frigidifontis TaxID=2584085 RepID=A0ABT8M8E5_9EURY|nr:universal stress protein [Methanoculleus sp. FWC-SCC1]MDN7024197.1 universal stress protein [Methanoculleus sp. FWC-SCC1]